MKKVILNKESTVCHACKHFHGKDKEGTKCKAFPDGIPFDIISGLFNHKDHYPNDHGIQFEPIKEGKR